MSESDTRSVTPGLVLADEDVCETILDVLGDETSRSILCAADTPSTAKELATACDLPISTVYRKIDELEGTPMVDVTTRPRLHGKHPRQVQRRVDDLWIRIPARPGCEVEITVRPTPRTNSD